jgi:DNA polymerase IV
MSEATTLHADLDAFYASVEQVLDPSLTGKPMAVGQGVVVAASYEARGYGVRAAMSTTAAQRLCPALTIVPGSFGRYLDFSQRVMAVFERFTPHIEQISVDEAFMDVSGSVHLFDSPGHIAAEIRAQVRQEIGLAVSIGIASTKFLAKIGSQVAKPDGLVSVPVGGELDFLHPLPVEILWGVGPATAAKLHRGGIETVGDIADLSFETLSEWLGPAVARHLLALAHNRDPRRVQPRARAKSVGSQQALGRGVTDPGEIDVIVWSIADRVGRRLRSKGRIGRTISVRVRLPPGRVVSRSRTLDAPTGATAALARVARALVAEAIEDSDERVTLIGMSVAGLVRGESTQMELGFEQGDVERTGSPAASSAEAVDRQVDEVRKRFGDKAVTRAALLGRNDRDAPDEFRKLAERD